MEPAGQKDEKAGGAKVEPPKAEKPEAAADKVAKPEPAKAPKTEEAPAGPKEAAGGKAAEPKLAEKPAEPRAAAASRERTSPLALAGAAIIGGLVSLAGAVGLDRTGAVDLFGGEQPDAVLEEKISALENTLADTRSAAESLRGDLEAQIAELKAQAPDGSAEAASAMEARIDALQDEIAALSAAAGTPDLTPLETRLAELESLIGSGGSGREVALEALETRLSSLGEKVEAQGSAADLIAPIDKKITMLDESGKEAISGLDSRIDELTRIVDEAGAKAADAIAKAEDAAARAESAASAAAVENAIETSALAVRKAEQAVAIAPVLAAESLQRFIDAGQPYEAALSAFDNLGVEDPALAALKPYAAEGLPTVAELRTEFAALADGFTDRPAAEAAEEGSALDRLWKGATSVVKVRPVEPQDGTGAAAIASRIEGALAGNDLDRALAEWRTLPDDNKADSQAWADKLQAIIGARQFADTVRESALARLSMTQ